jgi:arsenate reductase-like glutaredoxin family protein
MTTITENEASLKFSEYASLQEQIASIKATMPHLAELEKEAETVKKEIQDFAKETGKDFSAFGYEVKLSERDSWDTKALPSFVLAHPELSALKSTTVVATVRKSK